MTYSGTLPPGEWTVVADMGTPAIGRCEGVLHVAAGNATPTPDEQTGAPPPAPSAQAAPQRSPASFTWVWYLVGVLGVGGARPSCSSGQRRPP